ncbi:endo-1,3-beta glucanase, partial [Elasticomyces elasticus]
NGSQFSAPFQQISRPQTYQQSIPPQSSSNGLNTTDATASSTSSLPPTTIELTLGPGGFYPRIVTLTSLPSTQLPTATSATQNSPATTGSVITTLQTSGNPASQPFPTSLPTVSQSTLLPGTTTLQPQNSTSAPPPSITATITLPVSTITSVISATTVASVPVTTVVSISSITVVATTFTTNGTTVVSSTVGPTVINTTATVLSEATIVASSTVVITASTVVSTGTLSSVVSPQQTSACVFQNGCGSQNMFDPISVNPPPNQIPSVGGHPVPRLGITEMSGPIETNKFYANFFLGSQGFPAYVMPYSLTWSKGGGNAQSWGLSISHIDGDQLVYGPNNTNITGTPASYYINPVGIQSVILSAAELGKDTALTTDTLESMSGMANLAPKLGSASYVKFPLVQGMAFVTSLYTNLQPEIQSSVFFRSIASAGQPKTGVYKYRMTLEDGKVWLLYATPALGVPPSFQLVSSTMLQGLPNWSGTVQVAKLPSGGDETVFDAACGLYPTSGSVGGYASGSTGEYSISWSKAGPYANNGTLLMYALPHHVQSFENQTNAKMTKNQLRTTTKGMATAVAADYWVMSEVLPTTMGFAPWQPEQQYSSIMSDSVLKLIRNVSAIEASQNMSQQTNLNSMYYSGKALSKFATIIYTMNDLLGQQALAATALDQLKQSFALFAQNKQQFPLYYDTDWKGVVSSASYTTGDAGVDFGNSYYNDHHFHYGYFIHAASVIGYLDPAWATANKEYVNALVRDVANPSTLDNYFPVFRSFDWYNGHSWAKGLFESGDGKDEESTSEDAMFAYGMKMWGKTIGDKSMEARGNLMLSVLARSLTNYFLMDSDNKNQPAAFIGNRATGILFENKADHVTYFGTNIEYIQGIQMIPAMPFSTLTRTKKFVTEEWQEYFNDGAVDAAQNVQGGWKGILFGNLAIINPKAAWNFFSQNNFDASWLDGGASLTWYLAYAAGLGGTQ